MTATNDTTSPARPRRSLSRATRLALAGGVAAGAALGTVTGIASAATANTAPATTPSHVAAYTRPGRWDSWGRSGPDSGWPGFGPGTGWPGFGPGDWPPASSRFAEHFHVVSTSQAGPGAIIVTGVINAGGTEHPGRAIDHATFSDGTFRIDHSAGHPTVRFNAKTCVGTITQSGPFRVYDGTGRFSHLKGKGMYQFDALYTTAQGAAGCTKTVTAYTETINGTISLSPSVARRITSPGA